MRPARRHRGRGKENDARPGEGRAGAAPPLGRAQASGEGARKCDLAQGGPVNMASNGGLCVPETPAIGVGLACGAGSSTHRCRLSLRSGFTRRGSRVRLEAARFRYASRRRGGNLAARGACSVAENPVRFCLSVCRQTICTTSRDHETVTPSFAVTFPRLLAGEECGIILFYYAPALDSVEVFFAPAARRRSCAHRCHCELAIPRLARLR